MADPNKGCKITVYWLEQSRAQRIIWLLEELNLKYDLKTYKRGKDMLAPKELKDIHPLGKSPLISVTPASGGPPKVIAESAVITEYIIKHFGPQLAPKEYPEGKEGEIGAETAEFGRYRYFMHYAEASIMPPLLISLVIGQLKGPAVPWIARPLTSIIADQIDKAFLNREFKNHFDFLEEQLNNSGGDYICGPQLTGADIMLIFPLQAALTGPLDKPKYPKIVAYVGKLEANEAWKRAVKIVEEKTGEKYCVSPR